MQQYSDQYDSDDGGDARGCRRSCRRSVSVKRSGFHVTGPRSGSLGALLVPADWQVRLFGVSGIIDIMSNRLYIYTIPIYGCI